jgi:predicted transcriptional regulator of viral defense system
LKFGNLLKCRISIGFEVGKMNNTGILPENQKIFSMKELKDFGFSQYKVSKLVDEGKLKKLNKGYYENAVYQGEESDFYYTEAYTPNGVICLLSAAVYYNLSTYIPDAVDIAIPRKAKVSAIPDWPKMNVHYYTNERYGLGINTVQEGGNEFRIYDMEKTVVDIVFYREKIGIEETKEVLVTYLKRNDRNVNRLLKYGEMMKCGKVIREYLEVLV